MKVPVYMKAIFMYYSAMLSTLYRYLAKEVLSAFFLGLLVFTGVLLMGRMLKLADLVISKGAPLADVLLMIAYLLPNFAIITIPMSLLLAVLLAFSRLSGDSEIIAMKASGISLYRLLPPIMLIALAAYIVTTVTALYALPKGNIAFKELLYKSVKGRLSLSLKEQVFNSEIPGLLIYITRNSGKSGVLSGLMIQDERNPKDISTIFAETGSVDMDEQSNRIHLHLNDGNIHQSRANKVYRLLAFTEYDLVIDLPARGDSFDKNEIDMTLSEIRANLQKGGFSRKLTADMQLEVHRRFALPFACFIFALVAIPLGIQNRRSGKAAGFSYSIGALLLFYIFQSVGKSLAEKQLLTPFMAVWLPNFIFLAAGIWLFVLAAKETHLDFINRIVATAAQLLKKVRTA